MKVFVDECVNRRFMRRLTGHDFVHISNTPLLSTKNGALLRAVAPNYDAFLTRDASIPVQQNLKRFPLAFVILRTRSNRLAHLLPLVPDLLATLDLIATRGYASGDLYELVGK
jgi:hypothetical protein